MLQGVKAQLNSEFKMVDIGPATYYLGVQIQQGAHQIILTQEAYARQLLERYGLQGANLRRYPLSPTVEREVLEHPEALPDPQPYQKLVGELLYLAMMTRPDLAFAVSWLGRVNHCPTEGHLAVAKGVLRYLVGTAAYGIKYAKEGPEGPEAYCDASYAEDLTTRRSTGGFCIQMQGGQVAWKSGIQEVVATSSTEAEYVAYSPCLKEVKWVQATLCELGYPSSPPTKLFSDSQGAIALANSGGYRAKTKHIDVRYHFVRQGVESGAIRLEYLPTSEMPADGLTKPLKGVAWSHYLRLLKIEGAPATAA
jgi:hypothetical protein